MTIVKPLVLLTAGLISLAGATTAANAASPATESFLANVTSNVDFLDRSSRMALQNSKSVRLKDFAKAQATTQTLAANAIYDVTNKLADAPVQTGRSVAGTPAAVADTRMPLGQEDLDSIEGLNGIEFDEAFRAKQRDALLQVQSDYETYLVGGDDVALKAIAARELPEIRKKISALSKI